MITIKGEYVCDGCGMVDSVVLIPDPNFDEFGNTQRSFVNYRQHDLGLSGFIDYRKANYRLKRAIITGIEHKKSKNMFILADTYGSFLRLSGSAKERIGFLLHFIPEDFLSNEVIDDVILALIYIVLPEYNILLTFEDIKKYLTRDHKYFFKLIKKLKNICNITKYNINPDKFIKWILDKLYLGYDKVDEINKILDMIWANTNNRIIAAAAAVFIVMKDDFGRGMFMKLCNSCGISDVSLKKRIDKFRGFDDK